MYRPRGKNLRYGLLLLLALSSRPLAAMEISGGVASVDEGDDRMRPAFVAHVGNGRNFYARYFLYGRKFVNVTERTQMVSLNYAWPLFNGSWRAGVGIVELSEATTIKALDDSTETISETNYNTGASFGIFWVPQIKFANVSVGWESEMFLAGEAGLFLSTGRKEAFSFVLGFAL